VAADGDFMKAAALIYSTVFALAIFNGIFSPHSFTLFALQGIWYPKILPAPLSLMFILSGIISGVLHLMVTGVPAAILEKFMSLKHMTSGLVWLVIMLVPTYQTARHIGWL
jgi:hypothetical protein